MADLLDAAVSWQSLLAVVALFGFLPGFTLRLLVLIYPKESPRRTELVAALYKMAWWSRPLYVAAQLETVLFEGVPTRARALRQRHDERQAARPTPKIGSRRHFVWFLIHRALPTMVIAGFVFATAVQIFDPVALEGPFFSTPKIVYSVVGAGTLEMVLIAMYWRVVRRERRDTSRAK